MDKLSDIAPFDAFPNLHMLFVHIPLVLLIVAILNAFERLFLSFILPLT